MAVMLTEEEEDEEASRGNSPPMQRQIFVMQSAASAVENTDMALCLVTRARTRTRNVWSDMYLTHSTCNCTFPCETLLRSVFFGRDFPPASKRRADDISCLLAPD